MLHLQGRRERGADRGVARRGVTRRGAQHNESSTIRGGPLIEWGGRAGPLLMKIDGRCEKMKRMRSEQQSG